MQCFGYVKIDVLYNIISMKFFMFNVYRSKLINIKVCIIYSQCKFMVFLDWDIAYENILIVRSVMLFVICTQYSGVSKN